MRIFLISALFLSVGAISPFKPSTLGHIIPGRYIIEFDQDYQGSPMDFVSRVQNDLLSDTRVKMAMAYDSLVFRGISISVTDLSLHKKNPEHFVIRKILQQRQVKHVYPVREIPRPTVKRHAHVSAYNTVELPIVSIPQNGSPLPFTHQTTQVDRVHSEVQGDQIIVGIIDTGIDYRHPAFGSGFGPGYPVKYGYDLVGDNFNSMDPSTISESSTPLDACEEGSGHGTHVAGIIAANDRLLNFTGIAPQVTLGAWRVFGCDGSTSNDLVIKALLSAHEAGCNVINLSLGSPSNWADDPTSLVANRISEKGSIVVAAAGNEGGEGPFYISAPGSGKSTVSVASIDNTHILTPAFQVKDGTNYPYIMSTNTESFLEGSIVSYSADSPDNDACNGTQPSQDLTGHIVLVQRGTCTLNEKVQTVQNLGASAVIIYDNQSEKAFRPKADTATIPVISITMISGQQIKAQVNKQPLEVVSKMVLTPQKVPTSDQISEFSSVGPLYDVSLKPDLAAPGGYIFSTLPLANGGYGVLSGALALFMQIHGKNVSHTFIKEHFQNYAKPVLDQNPIRQGAGLIQVFDAIHQPVHVSPGHLSFNDTTHIQPKQLTIHNPTQHNITYTVKHLSGSSTTSFLLWNQQFLPYSQPTIEPILAHLNYSHPEFTLQPNQSFQLSVHVNQISGESYGEPFPIYGGYIQLLPSLTELKTIHIPYIGIRGSLDQAPIFADGFPRVLPDQEPLTIMYRLLTGTPRLITQVLDENMQLIGLASDDQFIPRNTLSNFVFIDRWNATMIPLGSESIGDLEPLPKGSYYLRWKALRLLSDPQLESSWESQVSSLIDIQ
ncbi:unnamed protein product [Rhizopus stolonifer]